MEILMPFTPKIKTFLSTAPVLLSLLLLGSLPASAQSSTGSLAGTVTDPAGAVVPNVSVTITHLETNRRIPAVTGADGNYIVTALPVGHYRVEAAPAGFKAAIRTGIVIAVNQTATIDLKLEVGSTSERIEIVGDATQLELSTSDVGKVVDNRRILELPSIHGTSFRSLT